MRHDRLEPTDMTRDCAGLCTSLSEQDRGLGHLGPRAMCSSPVTHRVVSQENTQIAGVRQKHAIRDLMRTQTTGREEVCAGASVLSSLRTCCHPQ